MSKKLIVRFDKKDVTWISDTLFKTKKKNYFGFPFCFEEYHEQLGVFFKIPRHFHFMGQLILSEILNQNVERLIWDATTGYINVPASSNFVLAAIPYKDHKMVDEQFFGMQSKKSLEKYLAIFEELGFLEVLCTTQKTKRVKLFLEKCNEALKKGVEEAINLNKHFDYMNNIDSGEFKYGRP